MSKRNLLEHFWDCITTKYFQFSGRASRPEFWGFILFSILMGYLAKLVDQSIVRLSDYDFITFGAEAIVGIVLMIPQVSVGVRRFHDTGKIGIVPIGLALIFSGPDLFSYISYLIPTLPFWQVARFSSFGVIILMVIPLAIYYLYVAAQRGDVGLNKYGPDPLNPELGHEIDQIGEE